MVLNAMREGAKSGISKFILMGFMVMAVVGLTMTDVGGFFRNGGISSNYVLKIEGQSISTVEFDNIVRRTLSRQGLDPQTAYQLGFIDQILTRKISDTLVHRASYDSGIQISDDVIMKQVSNFIAPYASSDMTKKEAFETLLRNQGLSEKQFVNGLKTEMATAIVKNAFVNGTGFISDQEVKDLYQFQNEERVIKTIIFKNDAIKDYPEPTDEILLPLYQAGQERFAIPETRNFSIAVMTSAKLAETLEVTDEELRVLYEEDIYTYKVAEQRQMAQAILNDQEEAYAIVRAIEDGKSLKEAVKNVTKSEDAYLGEDKFQQNGLVKEISAAAFVAAEGDVIGPVETPLGFHVLVLKDIIEPHTRPFAEIKDILHEDTLQDKIADQMFDMSGMIDDELASGKSLEETVEELGLDLSNFGPVRLDGSTADQKEGVKGFDKDRNVLLETAFELLEGEIAPIIELADGSYAVIRVDSIQEKSYRPFDDVKEDIKKIWVADQQQVLNKQRAQTALLSLANEEKTLKEIAADSGLSVKDYTVKRTENDVESLGTQALTKFFALENAGYSVAQVPDGFALGYIAQINLPKNVEEEQLAAIKAPAMRNIQNEYFLTYLEELRNQYGVKVNERAITELYGPGSEQ